jgi:hypothetical protein
MHLFAVSTLLSTRSSRRPQHAFRRHIGGGRALNNFFYIKLAVHGHIQSDKHMEPPAHRYMLSEVTIHQDACSHVQSGQTPHYIDLNTLTNKLLKCASSSPCRTQCLLWLRTIIITRFQSEDQVCISTTLKELDKSVLTQTCRCESQSRLSNA